jgi:CubicO group peptidase (beta-lactamase class C family)
MRTLCLCLGVATLIGCSSSTSDDAAPTPDATEPPAAPTPPATPDAPPPPPPPAADPHDVAFQSWVASSIKKYDIPGAQIAIVRNGKLAFSAALGNKAHGGSDPVTKSTRFRVASLSKVILGATALGLVEDGKLDLSQPVTHYAPSFAMKAPADASTIIVEQLLTHTSGLPDMGVSFRDCTATTLGDFFAGVDPPQPFWSPPGAVWDYTNRGFSVAGLVLEKVAGQSYDALATSRVLARAGMTNATFDLAAAAKGDHAVGWAPDPKTGVLQSFEPNVHDCVGSHPPAGISATAEDYAHFIETLLAGGGTMLSPASVAALETGRVVTDQAPGQTYGYGLDVHDGYKGLLVVHHNGLLDTGYLSSMWIAPKEKFGVVVFYNGLGRSADEASRYAIDLYLDKAKVPNPDYSTSPLTWSKYAGTYVDPNHFGTITVAYDGLGLTCDIPSLGVSKASMTQSEGDVFNVTIGTSTTPVTFYPDKSGAPSWWVTRSGVGAKNP